MAQIDVWIRRGQGQGGQPTNFATFQLFQMHPNGRSVLHSLASDFVPLDWPSFRTPWVDR